MTPNPDSDGRSQPRLSAMNEQLAAFELFDGVAPADVERLCSIASLQALQTGDYLFLLGEPADRVFVVLQGRLDVCLPLAFDGAMRDVAVETVGAGDALGWSAFVEPYRFTLSARAAEPSSVAAFPRQELWRVLDADPELGYHFSKRITELIGQRLLTFQALWARDLQRFLARSLATGSGEASPR
jgi:CRP/FNR family transcriptional regulator, cyclic AMP receptor protein